MPTVRVLFVSAFLLLGPAVVFAGYGFNTIGYGGESYAMGGADLARASSGLGSNVNPAGMSAVRRGNASAYFEYFNTYGWEHRDSLGNRAGTDPRHLAIFGGGFALRPERMSELVFGVAVLGQGGVGYTYPDLLTTAGNRDELSATFGVFRIAPSVAWQPTDRLSVGLGVGVNAAESNQKLFPDTSIAGSGEDPGFFGLKLKDLAGVSPSYRLGLHYRLSDSLVLGAAYGSTTELRLRDGNAVLNFEAIGLGRVRYGDASLRGLELPEELGVGISWQATERWELALETTRLNWSESVTEAHLKLTDPDNPAAPATIESVSALDFRDQQVVSVGTRYRWFDDLWLMTGFTWGRNPIPSGNVTPVLSVISETHYTIGLTRRFGSGWRGILSVMYLPRKTVSYTSRSLPLGEKAEQNGELIDLTFTIERTW